MPPKNVTTVVNPIRLQSVSRLRIRNSDKQEANPCLGAMTAMLSCWASSSSNSASGSSCLAFEKALKECMDKPKPAPNNGKSINYHLGRLYPKVRGPEKRRGSLG